MSRIEGIFCTTTKSRASPWEHSKSNLWCRLSLYQHPVSRGGKISVIQARPHNATPSNKSFLKPLRHVFLGNIFTFSNGDKLHYYLQTNGVSMGSKCAPSVACVFIGDFERQHLTNLPNDPLEPFIWLRYIDDIFAWICNYIPSKVWDEITYPCWD